MPEAWTDYEAGSVRGDGAKVGAFWPPSGAVEWWGYPKGLTPRGNVPATGPWPTLVEAKAAVDAALDFETKNDERSAA